MRIARKPRKRAFRRAAALQRLPGDFSWKLLEQLFGSLSDGLGADFCNCFRACLRARSVSDYLSLSERWGLQCMNPPEEILPPYKVASYLLLISLAKKEPTFETYTPSERKRRCIEGVLHLEDHLWNHKVPVDSVLSLAKGICQDLLGQCPDASTIAMGVKHGPGTAVGLLRNQESAYFKYSSWPYRVAPSSRSLLREVISLDERWLGSLEDSYRSRFGIARWAILNWDVFWENILEDCPFNKITSVPKDGTKDRPIAIEPVGNIFLQLGIERIIRFRLRMDGLDLNDQQPNQRLAAQGSTCFSALSPMTIDLSNASDTISTELVERVLPPDWFRLLSSVRSPWGLLPDGTALRYAKFSSMGNGATFVLESLIFYCLLKAVSVRYGHPSDKKVIRAYGDDLVAPTYLRTALVPYLKAWGFFVNTQKSFFSGPVRESCGSDFYYGYNVRPVFLKEIPKGVDSLVGLRNRLHRWFVLTQGMSIPKTLDEFFLSYVRNAHLLPVGPESDDEFDTYWHSVRTDLMPEFVHVHAYRRSPSRIPARDFWFRKLMHNLLHVETTHEGRFNVTMKGDGTLRQSWRTVYRSFYRDFYGSVQDHTRLRNED